MLLAPKPKSPGQQKAPPQLKTADATGPKRFATQAGFNTVQSVASLGEVIPLVFADYSVNQGGVRVSSNLLWSRMTSYGTTQQFEGIYLFSSGFLSDNLLEIMDAVRGLLNALLGFLHHLVVLHA